MGFQSSWLEAGGFATNLPSCYLCTKCHLAESLMEDCLLSHSSLFSQKEPHAVNINFLFNTKVKTNAFNGSNCMRLLWTYFCSFDYSFSTKTEWACLFRSCNTLIIICLWNASWSSHVEERLSTLSIHVSLRKKKKDRKKRGRKYNLFYVSHKRSSIVRSPGGQKLSHARNKRKAAMTSSFACAGTFFCYQQE